MPVQCDTLFTCWPSFCFLLICLLFPFSSTAPQPQPQFCLLSFPFISGIVASSCYESFPVKVSPMFQTRPSSRCLVRAPSGGGDEGSYKVQRTLPCAGKRGPVPSASPALLSTPGAPLAASVGHPGLSVTPGKGFASVRTTYSVQCLHYCTDVLGLPYKVSQTEWLKQQNFIISVLEARSP